MRKSSFRRRLTPDWAAYFIGRLLTFVPEQHHMQNETTTQTTTKSHEASPAGINAPFATQRNPFTPGLAPS
jgi:hypothetical protein